MIKRSSLVCKPSPMSSQLFPSEYVVSVLANVQILETMYSTKEMDR